MKLLNKLVLLFGIITLVISCRMEEDKKQKIEKIAFENNEKTTIEGDIVKIKINAEPKEAKAYDKISYWVSDKSLLEILPETNNDYVVFKGLKAGQGIIKASVNGLDVFCDVNVLSSNGTLIPYIVVSDYVIESEIGLTNHIIASLIGGTPGDNVDFIWNYTGQNRDVISLTANNNVAVVNSLNTGNCEVTVSHKKAAYSVNTLIFVKDKIDVPVYISTINNVINLNINDEYKEYSVNLYGKNFSGSNNNYHLFRHDIVNENGIIVNNSGIIGLNSTNNVGTITPKSKGIAKIRISHQDAEYPVEIVIIVNEEVEFKYISIEDSVIVINEGEFRMVQADIVGNVPEDYYKMFEFVNGNNNVIELSSSQNVASIRALKHGRSVIKIKNKYVDFDKELLVIVNGKEGLIDQEKYITTNQNVITTEVNAEALLTMTLVGGNSADANNFMWTVDDGSIIEVINQHGKVKYNSRSMLEYIDEKIEAKAIIKAKKIGTTTITLENPKARNNFQVVVKVYKQGVFSVVPVVISGPSIIKIEKNQNFEAYLSAATGLERNLTNISWTSSDNSVFSVLENSGLTGILRGVNNGIATVTVTGDNLKSNFSATVIVGNEDYFNEKPYIYVTNQYMTIIKDSTLFFRIICENVSPEKIESLSVINNSSEKLEVDSYRNNVVVKGISFGEGEIVVSGEGLNTLRIKVMVEDYALTPEIPYYLRPQQYIYGMVKGNSVEITVNLIGGSARDEKEINWNIIDPNVADIKQNNSACIVNGKNEGQTIIKISHPRSNNDLEIVIYVVLSDAELKNKVVVHISQQNILLREGEMRFISIVTNADASKGQNDFRWSNGNANVVELRVNADKKSAFLDALTIGNAAITVGYGNQLPYVAYISVVSSSSNIVYINTPSIVEMIAGQTININAVTSGVYDKFNITWNSLDESIAKTYGNGESCTVSAFKGGKTIIQVRYTNFIKDIILLVYNSNEDMASAYIFSGEQNRHVINKGDIVNISLVFGLKGYPEYDLPNIRWTTNDSTKIELRGSGKTASVKGLVAGFWKVRASDNYGNDIEIEIAVQETGKAGKYYFSIDGKDRIKGMLSGADEFIEVKVFNGTNEVFNVTGIEYAVENSDIIRVEGNEGGLRVYAKAGREGQSYITITHDLAEDGKILIYTSLTEGGLVNAYPIMVEKSNYMVNKGDDFNVTVQTINNDSSKLNNISYGLEKNSGVISYQEYNKKEITVSALKEGSEIILIRYNAEIVQRVYVSVMERDYGVNAGYAVTENIIGLVKGQVYETWVDTNISWGIEWKSENSGICEILSEYAKENIDVVEVNGKKAFLKANGVGEAIVTVKCGDIERYILVFVVNTPEELTTYHAVNIEQRRYKIPKGMDVTINVASYQGKVSGNTQFEDYYRYSVPYGNVVEVSKVDNGKISIKGKNEGIAAIKISNSYYNSDIVIYIEVYPVSEGEIGANLKEHYITAEKTLYVMDNETQDVFIQVGVLPETNFYGDAYWEWEGYDKNIISVIAMGRGALISRVNKGETKIRIINRECENSLEITVILGERFITDTGKVPYIYVEKDLFEMYKGSSNLEIPYSVVNVDNIISKNITFSLTGYVIRVEHDIDRSMFKIEAVNSGIGRFKIKYGDLEKEVYVLVKENLNVGNIYFTTNENFVIVSIGELRTINVDLIGYDENDGNKIEWSVSESSSRNVVQLAGNGLSGQIYGVAEGSVVINITHKRNDEFKAVYPLSINVKIVRDASKEKAIYLTTQRNVIETVEGAPDELLYIQKVGGDSSKSQIIWKVDNASIVSLNHNGGFSAKLKIHREGSVKITASNIEAAYELNIIVVVRKKTGSNIYLSSDSNLIWLSPGEKNRKITVNLVNGESKDYNKITWNAYEQIPSDTAVLGVESGVINIVSSNEQCYINAVNVGVAYIYVECKSIADFPLIITVYVSHFKEMQFSVSHKDVVIGEMEVVELNLPTYERLKDKASVWAVDINGNEINALNSTNVINVYYTNSIVMIQGLKTGHAVIRAAIEGKEGYAEMTVSVLEKHDPDVNRIVMGRNLLVLSDASGPITLNASVTGPDIYEGDLDDIQWEITRNYDVDETDNKKTLLDIMPKNVPYSSTKSIGRSVQISSQNKGNAIVKVSHPKVTEGYWKEIYIVIAEMNNKFTVNKSQVEVNIAREWQTVAVNIVGGTNKDYEQVRWVAKMQQKWDGALLEVVRIMGSGREVTLAPINNGETEVYVFYNGIMKTINVRCISDYYFDIINRNELMYPGEIRDMPYEISPASNSVRWDYTPGENGAVIVFTDISGSAPGGSGNIIRMLRVTALKEGVATIIGMPAQGRPVMVNISVREDYEFRLQDNQSGVVLATNVFRPHPKYEIIDENNNVLESCDGKVNISYFIYPGESYIKCITDQLPAGLTVDISPAKFLKYDSKRRAVYGGTITFTGTVEMNKIIRFQLYKKNAEGGEDLPVESTPERPTLREINIFYYFPDLEYKPIFIRGDGLYSNLINYNTSIIDSRDTIIDRNKNNKAKWMGNSIIIPNGEPVNYPVSINGQGYMTLGDGEEHYIIFDKKYQNADVNIVKISVGNNDGYEGYPLTISAGPSAAGSSGQFTAELVNLTIDNKIFKAVKLSGGDDYIVYNRIKLDEELFVTVTSDRKYTNNNLSHYTNKTIGEYYGKVYEVYEDRSGTHLREKELYRYSKSDFRDIFEYSYYQDYRYYTGIYNGYSLLNESAMTKLKKYNSLDSEPISYNLNSYYYSYEDYRKTIQIENTYIDKSIYNVFRKKYVSNYNNNNASDTTPYAYMIQSEVSENYVKNYYRYTNHDDWIEYIKYGNIDSNYTAMSVSSRMGYESVSPSYEYKYYNTSLGGIAINTRYKNENQQYNYEWNIGEVSTHHVTGSIGQHYSGVNYYYELAEGSVRNTGSTSFYFSGGRATPQWYTFPVFQGIGHEPNINIFNGKYLYFANHSGAYLGGSFIYYRAFYFNEVWVRNTAEWRSTGNTVVVPYFILNRYPYRYEGNGKKEQIIKFNSSKAKPMPSNKRMPVSDGIKYVTLKITYNKYDPTRNIFRDYSENLNIACITRQSSFQYFGENNDDSWVNTTNNFSNNNGEIEGPITNFTEAGSVYNGLYQ